LRAPRLAPRQLRGARAAAIFGAHWPLAMLMDNANAQKAANALPLNPISPS
jgi:hypothetical protein